jgi:hypothetical protein
MMKAKMSAFDDGMSICFLYACLMIQLFWPSLAYMLGRETKPCPSNRHINARHRDMVTFFDNLSLSPCSLSLSLSLYFSAFLAHTQSFSFFFSY